MSRADDLQESMIPNVIVVDPRFDAYAALSAAAREGQIGLHLRSSGRDAIRLARRQTVDAWIVAAELDDMSGHDFVDLLGQIEPVGKRSKVAMVAGDEPLAGRRQAIAANGASEAGAHAVLQRPISTEDLMRLLSLPAIEWKTFLIRAGFDRGLASLPVGISAAVIAVALLVMG